MERSDSESDQWYLLRVRSNFEKKTATALHRKGFEVFLPSYRVRRQWSDRVKQLEVPLFAGYLFCRYQHEDRIPVLSTPGLYFDVSEGREPVPVAEAEISGLRKILGSGFRIEPWPYPSPDIPMVWVRHEAFAGLRAGLVERDGTYLAVFAVGALRAAVAVEVPKELLVAGTEPEPAEKKS